MNHSTDVRGRLINFAKSSGFEHECLMYGDRNISYLATFGTDPVLTFKPESNINQWEEIADFFLQHQEKFVFGFIGFDPNGFLKPKDAQFPYKTFLFSPREVFVSNAEGLFQIYPTQERIHHDSFDQDVPGPIQAYCRLKKKSLHSKEYLHYLKALKTEIIGGAIDRLTAARRVYLPMMIDDLTIFFSSMSCETDISKNFYFSNKSENFAFAGQSPEILAQGSVDQGFLTHKLSGTYPVDTNRPIEEQLKNFLQDSKIIKEHRSAMVTLEKQLNGLGDVFKKRDFECLVLPSLIHGITSFFTKPQKHMDITQCLKSVFPYGMSPVNNAVSFLDKFSTISRGPYYGLVGMKEPKGFFSFTQVLRTVFEYQNQQFVLSGAAITLESDPKVEMEESIHKIYSIFSSFI